MARRLPIWIHSREAQVPASSKCRSVIIQTLSASSYFARRQNTASSTGKLIFMPVNNINSPNNLKARLVIKISLLLRRSYNERRRRGAAGEGGPPDTTIQHVRCSLMTRRHRRRRRRRRPDPNPGALIAMLFAGKQMCALRHRFHFQGCICIMPFSPGAMVSFEVESESTL